MDKLVKIVSPPDKKERIMGDNPRMIILGSSGSGKSFITCRMLLSEKPFYKNYFRKVFYVNSTLKHSEKNNPYNIIDIEEDNIYEEMNDETIADIFTKLPKGKDGKIRPWLIAIDDSGYLPHNTIFSKKTFYDIRHSNGSVIMCCQTFQMIPPPIRKNITHLILMNNTNKKMVEDVGVEVLGMDKKEALEKINEIFEDTEDTDERPFAFIDVKKSKLYSRFPELKDT